MSSICPPIPLRALVSILAASLLSAGCSKDADTGTPSDPGGSAALSDGSQPTARHLLLISVDALRADALGMLGGPPNASPNIDKLAVGGTLFEHCYAVMGMTLPSMASVFTSRYPEEHGVLANAGQLADTEATMAESLAKAGFRNRAMVANGALAPEFSNLDQGYREGDFLRVDSESELSQRAVQMLREDFGAEHREFLWLHYMAPHAPYDPPVSLVQAFDEGEYDGPYDGQGATIDPVFVDRIDLASRDLAHIRALYQAEVNMVDRLVRSVLEALRTSGQEENTLVVFTADHGEEVYDHQYYFYHANSPYRSVLRVPLVFRFPGVIPEGNRITAPVSLVDLMPTMLGLLGVPFDKGGLDIKTHGMDLRPMLLRAGSAPARTYAFNQISNKVFCVRTERWCYIQNSEGYVPRSVPEAGEFRIAAQELYDLREDPEEMNNIAADNPDVVERLERALDAWRLQQDRSRPKLRPKLTPERIQELRELGYLGYDGD